MRREIESKIIIESDGRDSYVQVRSADDGLMFAFRVPAEDRFHKHIVTDLGAKMRTKCERIRTKAGREND